MSQNLSRDRRLACPSIPRAASATGFQVNFRNHRKIVVVDGYEAWLGGLNIGDEYLGKDRKLSPWRDTHLHIVGPAALVAQSIFWSDWYWADQSLLKHLHWQPEAAPGVKEGDGQDVLVLGSGPADELETASLFFTTVLNAARERVWIATPYFIPDEATQVSLRLALLRGVDVRILTPRLNDNWFVKEAANVYLSEFSLMGARIFFYERGFMHQKVVLVDDGPFAGGHGEFRQPLLPAQFRGDGGRCRWGVCTSVDGFQNPRINGEGISQEFSSQAAISGDR